MATNAWLLIESIVKIESIELFDYIMYDIAIIGAGAAGLQLALAMHRDPFFAEKKILLLEKGAKDQNDRTWCFWEKGEGKWDALLRQSWAKGDFYYKDYTRPLDLLPYRYKMLRGLDFYTFAKKELNQTDQFTWQTDHILSVTDGEPIQIQGEHGSYSAEYVFDSRIPEAFFEEDDPYTRLLQHFKGWVIRTPEDRFDPERFTMMDYRLRWENTTSFTYVLPLNRREALVEFTLFSPSLLKEGEYDQLLQQYCDKTLKIKDFEIIEVEQGVIPMTDFPFEKYSLGNHVHIGTGGGWVKPSTGYSFKNCERNAQRIVNNLKAGRPANQNMISSKFRLYDAIFLDVLNRRNGLGPSLFYTMYQKNSIQQIFEFLDDESGLLDDLRIIVGFPKLPFLRALFNFLIR